MPRINVTRPFRHADVGEIHAREYETGEQEVSERCAEVAIAEGWAKGIKAEKSRPKPEKTGKKRSEGKTKATSKDQTGSRTGGETAPSSSGPDRASHGGTSNGSGDADASSS